MPQHRGAKRLVLPVLERYSGRQLAALVGADRRTIDRIRQGQQPRPLLATDLKRIAVKLAEQELESHGVALYPPIQLLTPTRDLAVLELRRRHSSSGDYDS